MRATRTQVSGSQSHTHPALLMNVTSSFSSALNPIANVDAMSLKASVQDAARSSAGAKSDSAGSSLPNVVFSAQAQSALAAEQAAQAAAANATSFSALENKDITVTTVSFSGIYKNQLLQAVDPGDSGTISKAPLERQVLAGGGTQA
jgi:hypothetical protein